MRSALKTFKCSSAATGWLIYSEYSQSCWGKSDIFLGRELYLSISPRALSRPYCNFPFFLSTGSSASTEQTWRKYICAQNVPKPSHGLTLHCGSLNTLIKDSSSCNFLCSVTTVRQKTARSPLQAWLWDRQTKRRERGENEDHWSGI